MRKPLEIPELTAAEAEALDTLYRTTRDVRLRTRAQIVLLAGEQRLIAPAIARIVRESDQTVRVWLKRWLAEGLAGLQDRPMPGGPRKITAARDFFTRHNQQPHTILSVIGSKARNPI